MRAAIYARYSSDLQRDTSLEDQIAVAKRYATERSWTVLKEHIYSDAGISGASMEKRPGVQRMLAEAARQRRSPSTCSSSMIPPVSPATSPMPSGRCRS